MSLTSVSPDNPMQGQAAPSSDDAGFKQPPNVPVPSASPMNTSELSANRLAGATLQGDAAIASRPQQSSSSSGGGGGGGIFGAIGSIIGSLFAQGGYVNAANHNQYAAGGEVDADQSAKNDMLATGYLIGALHQSKFGGTPDTLGEAANHIKSMLGGGDNAPQGLAQGGTPANPSPDSNLADQELTQALGLFQPAQPQNLVPQNQGQPQQQQQQMPQGLQNSMTSGNPNAMRGYATGGPPQAPQMPPQQPQGGPPTIMSPNQDAPVEGEIKGPGGPTDDLIPAKLSNGEFVMSAAATQYFGVDKLAKMNDQGKQGFMQKVQQVQDNQQQGGPQGAAPPGMPPGAPPMGMMQPPIQRAQGGSATVRTRGSGYCGL